MPKKPTSPKAEIKKLEKEVKDLKQKNKDLLRLINSRKYRNAERLAKAFNKLFPVETYRRSVVINTGKAVIDLSRLKTHRDVVRAQKRLAQLVGDRDVIIYDSIPWNVPLKQRPQHLAHHLSLTDCFVLYLERGGEKALHQVSTSLVTTNNLAVLKGISKTRGKKYFFVSSTNAHTHAYKIVRSTFNGKVGLIYEYIDDISDDISPNVYELQEFYDDLKIHKPELILASSKKLFQSLVNDGFSKNILLLSENAVNVEHFDYTKIEHNKPLDLKKILSSKKPIVGYYGALAPWLDAQLMNDLAKKRKDLEFVYIGPDYGGGKKDFKQYPNTHFLGAKNYDELPNYAQHFDCAIIPFKLGDIAEATSPVKLFEYMAMGLPTVGTRDLLELHGYKHVHVSKDGAEFERNIDKAISEKSSPDARSILLAQAKQNTWGQRAKAIAKYLHGSKK